MKTKERLAAELEKVSAPAAMIADARAGKYDDYESDSETPITDLIKHAKSAGLFDIAERALRCEFDGTLEEGEAWFRATGHKLLEAPPEKYRRKKQKE